jgi:small subunit ribosomal protein S9
MSNSVSYIAVGRRKSAVAKVTLSNGQGNILVNNKPGELYFNYNSTYLNNLKSPLTTLELENEYDICISTKGGGIKGQIDASKLAIARALCYMSSEKRPVLKKENYLTRDARVKERKKYGLKKARKAPQYSKR